MGKKNANLLGMGSVHAGLGGSCVGSGTLIKYEVLWSYDKMRDGEAHLHSIALPGKKALNAKRQRSPFLPLWKAPPSKMLQAARVRHKVQPWPHNSQCADVFTQLSRAKQRSRMRSERSCM